MLVMSFPLREKELPAIPVDIDVTGTVVEDEGRLVPSPKIAMPANRALPTMNVEKTLSEEEMGRLHDLWNGAGLSARAHRRRHHSQHPKRRIPVPISIPKPQTIPLALPSADPPMTSTTPSTTGTRKRWGFFSARPFSEAQEAERKVGNALGILRAVAQDRLKKKLRYAKSAPNLGDKAAPSKRGVRRQPALPMPDQVEAAPEDVNTGGLCILSSSGERATPKVILQPEDIDENAIYFTLDPDWRASRGSVQFQSITPIPDSPTSLGRPDSPLLHRHYSLDQLASAELEANKVWTAMELPEVNSSDEDLHPIDELHTYLEL